VFGALLVAVIEFIRVVYEFIARNIEQNNPDNKLIECLLCVGRCCLKCLQCLIEFINRNAYITIAITGKNFCYAAKEGFEIVWSNPLRFGAMAGVGRALSFVGNLFIISLTSICFYLLIQYTSFRAGITNPYLLTALVALISLLISMVFIYVFSSAMDTILICFILDEQVQKALGGNSAKAIRAPPEIAELLQ
jgi:choline transporter-like protein 2/4/5